jgi:hypothetical protein
MIFKEGKTSHEPNKSVAERYVYCLNGELPPIPRGANAAHIANYLLVVFVAAFREILQIISSLLCLENIFHGSPVMGPPEMA